MELDRRNLNAASGSNAVRRCQHLDSVAAPELAHRYFLMHNQTTHQDALQPRRMQDTTFLPAWTAKDSPVPLHVAQKGNVCSDWAAWMHSAVPGGVPRT